MKQLLEQRGALCAPLNRHALLFTGPRAVEVVEESVGPPGPAELLVRTRVSAVSAGTEGLAYRGQLPPELTLDETLPALAGGGFRYPFRYGYAAVGEVAAAGEGVDPGWVGRRVWSFQPHASAFVAAAADCHPIPEGLGWEQAALFASQETAVNLVLDGQPRLGERVAVVGQGVVGLLTTALLARFPLAALVAVEPNATRAAQARRLGAMAVADEAGARGPLTAAGADLCFELSGDPAALDTALRLTGREGRVVVGSFYGNKRAPVDLGTHFHRGRLTVLSSQVSHLAPGLRGRWDRQRRAAATWAALAQLDAGPLISHRFPLARAAEAYRLLDAGAGTTLQILFSHE